MGWGGGGEKRMTYFSSNKEGEGGGVSLEAVLPQAIWELTPKRQTLSISEKEKEDPESSE